MKRFTLYLTVMLVCLNMMVNVQAQLKNGEVVRIKNVNSGKYAIPVTTDYSNQIVLSGTAGDIQNWKVVYINGFYKFQNVQTGKFLGLRGASKAQYGFINQKPSGNHTDQQWKLENTSTAFKLKNRNSGLYAAVEGGSKSDNAKLVQWADNAQPDILWQFETVVSGTSSATGKKVLYDITLNYIAVSEATRNQIDNGDCRRIFGQVSTELWELDDDNEMKTRLRSYNNMPELIYNQTNYKNPPTAGLSYHQDNRAASDKNNMGKVTYNIPESLLTGKKLMLVVITNVGTRHKDNDFATYDALKMSDEVRTTYKLNNSGSFTETIQTITDHTASGRNMHLQDFVVPFAVFQRTDDTHKIWVKFTGKKN